MKGIHLIRVTKAQGALRVPLSGVQLETLRLTEVMAFCPERETVLLVLEGEVVLDLPGDFVHLRRTESFTVGAETVSNLNPVQESVVLLIAGNTPG